MKSLREVGSRTLTPDSGGLHPWATYTLSHNDSANPTPTVHANLTLVDASGVGAKTWNFFTANTSGVAAWQVGLVSSFVQQSGVGGTALSRDTYTWALDGSVSGGGRPYISSKVTVADEAGTNPQTSRSDQTLDRYGNVTVSKVYGFNNTTTPVRTFNNTYLYTQDSASKPYIANYVLNRVLSTTVTLADGTTTKTLATNTYDSYNVYGTPPSVSGAALDPNPPVPLSALGLLWQSTDPSVTTTRYYWDTGLPYGVIRSDGNTASFSSDAATNYSAPMSIATQSYSESVNYNSWLGVTHTTGANGETLQMAYDTSGRPKTGVSPYGATTTYTYSGGTCVPASACPAAPAQWQQQTGPNGVTTTTLDGMGRTIRVQRGDTTGVQSIVDTVYAPCACSPLGKIQQVSQPYAPGATPVWTFFTYDGLGRTVSVVLPDGHSTTSTSYSGNQTTVTDPALNWKTFTKDALGNLTTVVEPDPNPPAGGTLTTTYTYDWMNHVYQVTMMRAGNTQVRTFGYNDKGQLTSAANPENGTVTYTYNTDTTLQYKHDAMGADTVYSYDSAKRVTMIQRYPQGQANAEDTCQRVTYTCGNQTANFNYGRLVTMQYQRCVTGMSAMNFTEQHTYNAPGLVLSKQFGVARYEPTYNSGQTQANRTMQVKYTYTQTGAVNSISYPMSASGTYSVYDTHGVLKTYSNMPPTIVDAKAAPITQCYTPDVYFWCNPGTSPPPAEVLTYGYDSMGRPSSLADNYATSRYMLNSTAFPADPGVWIQWAQNAVYDAAGRMTSLQYLTGVADNGVGTSAQTYTTETMTYNVNGQLASLGFAGGSAGAVTGGIQYNYSATQNNGQITQTVDAISGETISYQYDALKRLVAASSTPNAGSSAAAWSQSFVYDGFGNMTGNTLNGVTSTIPVNAATNQVSGVSYDLNGNMLGGAGTTGLTYDAANRMVSAQTSAGGVEYFGYGPDNKQVYRLLANGSEEFTLYGLQGEKLGVYAPGIDQQTGQGAFVPLRANVWFAGKMIWSDGAPVYQDRLGTNRAGGARFYQYGNEITSTANDREKFGTYTRDGYTGLDYADQRYYAATYGRFDSADPYQGSAGPNDPTSWNRYSYVGGDPVNRLDPRGLDWWDPNSNTLHGDPPGILGVIEAAGSSVTHWINEAFGDLRAGDRTQQMQQRCQPPPAPPGISSSQLTNMIDTTKAYALSFGVSSSDLAQFLYSNFRSGGTWDFKSNYDATSDPAGHRTAQDFGNFAFGAVMQSLGLSYYMTQSIAGTYQTYLCQSGGACGAGTPFVSYPYGDQPADAAVINAGYTYERLRSSGVCP